MTDSRTIELREKLTERGVEWRDYSNEYENVTTFTANGVDWYFITRNYLDPNMTLRAKHITPEQVIAAVLGEKPRDRTEEWLFNACNQATQDYVTQLEQERDELQLKLEATTLRSGTLTAEQVREAIEKRFDFDVWVPAVRWQAIADELNKKLRGDN